jgi:hypothetical protein
VQTLKKKEHARFKEETRHDHPGDLQKKGNNDDARSRSGDSSPRIREPDLWRKASQARSKKVVKPIQIEPNNGKTVEPNFSISSDSKSRSERAGEESSDLVRQAFGDENAMITRRTDEGVPPPNEQKTKEADSKPNFSEKMKDEIEQAQRDENEAWDPEEELGYPLRFAKVTVAYDVEYVPESLDDVLPLKKLLEAEREKEEFRQQLKRTNIPWAIPYFEEGDASSSKKKKFGIGNSSKTMKTTKSATRRSFTSGGTSAVSSMQSNKFKERSLGAKIQPAKLAIGIPTLSAALKSEMIQRDQAIEADDLDAMDKYASMTGKKKMRKVRVQQEEFALIHLRDYKRKLIENVMVGENDQLLAAGQRLHYEDEYVKIRKTDIEKNEIGTHNWTADDIRESNMMAILHANKIIEAMLFQDKMIWLPGFIGFIELILKHLRFFIQGNLYDRSMILCVLANTCTLAMFGFYDEDDPAATVNVLNKIFTYIFIGDMIIKIIAFGLVSTSHSPPPA